MIKIKEKNNDYRSTMIVVFIGFVLFLFSVLFHFAFAFNIQNVSISGNNPYTISWEVLDNAGQTYIGLAPTDFFLPSNAERDWLVSCDGTVLYNDPNYNGYSLCYYPFTGNGTYSTTFTVRNGYEVGAIELDLSSDVSNVDSGWFSSPDWDSATLTNPDFHFFGNSVPTNQTWGSDNGFWGETTPSVIIDDMTASVQSTATPLWPLFAFVGVGLAFAIAGLLVTNIKDQVKTTKKNDVINPQGYEFIEHSAEDREFVRNYGQETPKRKRGRPRKVL